MSDFNQLEMRRGSLFKDAVLSLAEARSMEIIAEAGKKRAEELELAYKLAESADYAAVREKYYQESEKEFMAVASQVRQELLVYRSELVDSLFQAAKEQLLAFTQTAEYPAWLAGLLKAHLELAAAGRPLTLRLRPADMPHKEALLRLLPQAQVLADKSIRLGGLKIDDGRVLFDETLDEKLRAEQERFYMSGHMAVGAYL